MTLPVSGAISFNNINVELGVSGTTQASLGQSSYRTLAGVPSGAISMSNFYGKANQFAFTISSNQTNANLATLATTAGWNGTTKVVATIGSGVYISSNSTGTPGLTINGSFPGGVELVNNGYIVGMGGAGGLGGNYSSGGASGSAGGLALSVSSAVSITNNGTIGGGGGGGGGGSSMYKPYGTSAGAYVSGGGGGGGQTGTTNSAGGSGGGCCKWYYLTHAPGGNGGAGTSSAAGSGGSGGYDYTSGPYGTNGSWVGAGGSGGSWGASGGSGGGVYYESSDYSGIWGAGGGGSAGGCLTGNSNITWVATGTRLGSIS